MQINLMVVLARVPFPITHSLFTMPYFSSLLCYFYFVIHRGCFTLEHWSIETDHQEICSGMKRIKLVNVKVIVILFNFYSVNNSFQYIYQYFIDKRLAESTRKNVEK